MYIRNYNGRGREEEGSSWVSGARVAVWDYLLYFASECANLLIR